MKLQTLSDLRAEMARRRVTQRALAAELKHTEASLSHLFSWEEEVVLSPEGAKSFERAINAVAGAQAVSA